MGCTAVCQQVFAKSPIVNHSTLTISNPFPELEQSIWQSPIYIHTTPLGVGLNINVHNMSVQHPIILSQDILEAYFDVTLSLSIYTNYVCNILCA